jgi:pyridoxal phosphate enzyme (YggS family)
VFLSLISFIKNNVFNKSMMPDLEKLDAILHELNKYHAKLVAVSKSQPVEAIRMVMEHGYKVFGENYVQELYEKQKQIDSDPEWHFIGHLQTNKVKLMAPFIEMIHTIDSFKLLKEVNKEAAKNERVIDCLLQVFIASEETKFGMTFPETEQLLEMAEKANFQNIRIRGLMGMATLTDDINLVRTEFGSLKRFFDSFKTSLSATLFKWDTLSMGMTSDYKIALEEGSTLVRIGSAIFGERLKS